MPCLRQPRFGSTAIDRLSRHLFKELGPIVGRRQPNHLQVAVCIRIAEDIRWPTCTASRITQNIEWLPTIHALIDLLDADASFYPCGTEAAPLFRPRRCESTFRIPAMREPPQRTQPHVSHTLRSKK